MQESVFEKKKFYFQVTVEKKSSKDTVASPTSSISLRKELISTQWKNGSIMFCMRNSLTFDLNIRRSFLLLGTIAQALILFNDQMEFTTNLHTLIAQTSFLINRRFLFARGY